ncbi:TPA: hypothetical protein ACTXXA_002321 [Legionella anisa]
MKKRIARLDKKHGVYHDLFVYPRSDFNTISDERLCMSNGIFIIEKREFWYKAIKTAYATIKGFEIMRMFKKGQFNIWMYGNRTEISFINEQFGLYC